MPSEMLICAGRKPPIVAVEMVNYHGVFEKELDRAGTANETEHGYQRRYRGPLHRAAIRPCFSAPYFRPKVKTRLTRLAVGVFPGCKLHIRVGRER